jgi:hypothetical protein
MVKNSNELTWHSFHPSLLSLKLPFPSSNTAYNPNSLPRLRLGGLQWIGLACRHITETVDEELIFRNEYLVAENRILKAPIRNGCSFPR